MTNDYLVYTEQTVSDLSAENIAILYQQGFLFGRRHKGDMYQTRSLRIDLERFELSSENRRVLRKSTEVEINQVTLPYPNYTWEIHQMGKAFYSQKFGDGTMSASKIKAMFTEPQQNNFNQVLVFSRLGQNIGYCICYSGAKIIHYTYPFYQLDLIGQTIGIAMMTKAIVWAQEQGYQYIYLGSAASEAAKYKLQFAGIEWWNNLDQKWSIDIDLLKSQIFS